MVGALHLLACVASPSPLGPPEIAHPSADVVYARRITLAFDREVWLDGEATDGTHTISIAADLSREPTFSLVGLYADRTWTVTLQAREAGGRPRQVDPFEFTTEPLPPEMPRIDLLARDPASEPGFTLVPMVSPNPEGWLVVLDADGEVAWTWANGKKAKFLEAHALEDGVLAMHGNSELAEIAWDGTPRRSLADETGDGEGIAVPVPIFHHELAVLDDGSWLTMTSRARTVPEYPVSYTLPILREADVEADALLILDPSDGTILEEIPVADDLDPLRIGYDSLDRADGGLGYEWTHANSACADDDGAWIVSLRHQDAVIALDRETRALRWILGTPANWGPAYQDLLLEPVGEPFAWHWHQHAAKCLGDGRILMFDNGNYGTTPNSGVEPAAYETIHSRVVQCRVDPDAGTVSQEWTFEPDPPVYSSAMGDADLLPGGTVLATFAFVRYIDGQVLNDLGRGQHSFELLEFEPETGRVVWGVDVWAAPTDPIGTWRSYRASRFASFGPGGPEAP